MPSVILDTEVYPGYFLAALKNIETGEVVALERITGPSGQDTELDITTLSDIMENDLTYGFNSLPFDCVIIAAAIAGLSNADLVAIRDALIVLKEPIWAVERNFKFRVPKRWNHIDLIEVAPLDASLKIYNGRLHGKRMQDLPYDPNMRLNAEQREQVKDYCINSDIPATELLLNSLAEPLALRNEMSIQYSMDLRSKSDAQIAEAVIKKEVEKITRREVAKPPVEEPGEFNYTPPAFIGYSTPYMQDVLRQACAVPIVIDYNGRVSAPGFDAFNIRINKSTYKIGIGGIHSQESCRTLQSTETHTLLDRDVASYYPALIINNDLAPSALGEHFMPIYRGIRDRRLDAKRAKRKTTAESLKIVINGTFGKLGQPGSILYAPRQMINTTLTGQLALLMAIEEVEAAGIEVVSANTDGFTSMVPHDQREQFNAIMSDWEERTNFETEEVAYRSMHNRDVNNYIAIKDDGSHKGKGVFANPWSASPPDYRGQLSKNPQTTICIEAVVAYLTHGTPLRTTIEACQDIRQFVTVRKVNGGATWNGQYLGKAIRWYYAARQYAPIHYASNGNRVPKSDGAMPIMELPEALPNDIDYDWYVREAESMLVDIGAVPGMRRKGEPDEREMDLFAA
jgi:hypothetical protein